MEEAVMTEESIAHGRGKDIKRNLSGLSAFLLPDDNPEAACWFVCRQFKRICA